MEFKSDALPEPVASKEKLRGAGAWRGDETATPAIALASVPSARPMSAPGAPLPREDVSVAAANWGSAGPFERSARDAD